MVQKSAFSREEKTAAVELVNDGWLTALSVANKYGVHENAVSKRKRQNSNTIKVTVHPK